MCSAVCFNSGFLCFAFFVAFFKEMILRKYFQLKEGKVSNIFPVHGAIGGEVVMTFCFRGQLLHTVSCTGEI